MKTQRIDKIKTIDHPHISYFNDLAKNDCRYAVIFSWNVLFHFDVIDEIGKSELPGLVNVSNVLQYLIAYNNLFLNTFGFV